MSFFQHLPDKKLYKRKLTYKDRPLVLQHLPIQHLSLQNLPVCQILPLLDLTLLDLLEVLPLPQPLGHGQLLPPEGAGTVLYCTALYLLHSTGF